MSFPRKPIEVSDDLESFVHVIIWQVQRYHKLIGCQNIKSLHQFIRYKYLVTSEISGGYAQAQPQKMNQMMSAVFGDYKPSPKANSPALLSLLASLLGLCQEHYQQVDTEKMEEWYAAPLLATIGTDAQNKDANVRVLEAYTGPTRLQSHEAMLELFDEACEKTRVLEKSEPGTPANVDLGAYDWIPDKFEDQFAGMPELKSTSRLGSSTTGSAKRPSARNEGGSSNSAKRTKMTTSSKG